MGELGGLTVFVFWVASVADFWAKFLWVGVVGVPLGVFWVGFLGVILGFCGIGGVGII